MALFAFPFALAVIGGVISLAAIVERHHRSSAPRIGFPLFLAGVFALPMAWMVDSLVEMIKLDVSEMVSFLVGYGLGLVGGAGLGYWLGGKHRRHLFNSMDQSTTDNVAHDG